MSNEIIEAKVKEFVAGVKSFTSIDIANEIKKGGHWVRNRDVAKWLREEFQYLWDGYTKKIIDVDDGYEAILYYSHLIDPDEYVTTDLVAITFDEFSEKYVDTVEEEDNGCGVCDTECDGCDDRVECYPEKYTKDTYETTRDKLYIKIDEIETKMQELRCNNCDITDTCELDTVKDFKALDAKYDELLKQLDSIEYEEEDERIEEKRKELLAKMKESACDSCDILRVCTLDEANEFKALTKEYDNLLHTTEEESEDEDSFDAINDENEHGQINKIVYVNGNRIRIPSDITRKIGLNPGDTVDPSRIIINDSQIEDLRVQTVNKDGRVNVTVKYIDSDLKDGDGVSVAYVNGKIYIS